MTEKLSDERLVTVFENMDGERSYQPTLSNGERLYYDYSAAWGDWPDYVWQYPPSPEIAGRVKPVLYNSERRAHRKSLREKKRRARRQRRTFREVTK